MNIWPLAATVVCLAAPIGAAFAQTPHTVTLRLDNDAFNFWTMPWNRPDGEYTSGVHITYDGGSSPRWSHLLFGRNTACVPGVSACTTARAEIGQDIYTPSLRKSDSIASADARPNAGWLYLSQTARALGESRADEITLTLGVTGPPSLARVTQHLAHSAAPEFNRPIDWSRQISFEPGIIARWDQQRRLAVNAGGLFAADVLPKVAVSLGNVNTSAEVGVKSRVGLRLPHPWLPDKPHEFDLALVTEATGHLVARDIFLDGNTFHPTLRVGHRPFVGTGELGLEMHLRAVSLAYRAEVTSRTYDAAPRWHPWSSMVASVTF